MTTTDTGRRVVLAGLIAGALALAAAEGATAADKVRLGALRFTSHAAGFIAEERGYFADAGLDVEFTFFQAAQPMAVAIASGDVDFGVTAITAGLVNLAAKDAVRVIGGALHEEKGIDGSAILASNAAWEAGFTSPAKLAGRSLAITQAGSSFHYMAALIAEKEGFGIGQVTLRPLQQVGAMIAALQSGQVDAMIIVPHIARPLETSGAAKIVGWINDYAPYQVTTVFTSKANADGQPERVKAFLAAYARGIADYNGAMLQPDRDPAAAEAVTRIIHKYVNADQPWEKASVSIRAGTMRLNEGARLNVGSVRHQLEWFQSEGLVDKAIGLDKLVDTRFVETY